ncbi:MAG: PDZ domain-containing protein, partial [Anaerolineales bacterium]|nr:PDZ domain-containing protein [Anaerolineales bacterium]
GLGFAIPVNTAGAVAEQIIEKGYFSRPYLGIRWQAITPEISAAYRLPVEWGVYVAEVLADSPAAASGLRHGDIITRIGDISLDEEHSYINTVFNYRPGDRITIQVLRGNEQVQLEVTLGEAKN